MWYCTKVFHFSGVRVEAAEHRGAAYIIQETILVACQIVCQQDRGGVFEAGYAALPDLRSIQ